MEEQQTICQCVHPPELDEIELIAAADEEASPEVCKHLATCPACAARVQTVVELQGRLHERLYRAFCPSSDDLAAFVQAVAIPADRARVAKHLSECPHCQRESALLEAITVEPLALPFQSSQRIIAQLQWPDLLSSGEPSIYRAGTMRIALSIEQQRGSRLPRLRGAVRGYQRGTTASLICNGRVVCAAPLNEYGGFILDDLSNGDFSLSLRLPGCEVVVEALRF